MGKEFFSPEPRVFAHRGASCEFPENTLPAFRKAVEIKADVIETDTHFTKDGKFVMFHDDILERLTDGKGRITDFTLDELKQFDAGYSFTPDGTTFPFRGKGLTMLSLDELLEEFPDQRFNIDLKDKNPRQVVAYCETIRRHNAGRRVLTASNYRTNIRRVRTSIPEMATSSGLWEVIGLFALFKTGFLFMKKHFATDALQIPEFIGTSRIATANFIRQIHENGLRVHIWTVNKEEDMRRLIEDGVDGIVTDNPALLQRVYESLG